MKNLKNAIFLAVITAAVAITAAANPVKISNVEELSAAVNDASNAGVQIRLAPGLYEMTVLDPAGAPRPREQFGSDAEQTRLNG